MDKIIFIFVDSVISFFVDSTFFVDSVCASGSAYPQKSGLGHYPQNRRSDDATHKSTHKQIPRRPPMTSETGAIQCTRMNAVISGAVARKMREEGIPLNLSMNAILLPATVPSDTLLTLGTIQRVNWAHQGLRNTLTPEGRPDCHCGGHLNKDYGQSSRPATCSHCDTPHPTGTTSIRERVTKTYEPSLSDDDDGFSLVIRDSPKMRATKKTQSQRGGRWETYGLFCLAACRLRGFGDRLWAFTDSTGRYCSDGLLWAFAVHPDGTAGVVAIHPSQTPQFEGRVRMTADPFDLVGNDDAPAAIGRTYGGQ